MEQEVRFCTATDGVRIAYSTVGYGIPFVKAANWLTHLEYDWDSPVWRHWLREIAKRHTLVRYDERGCGLSDWHVKDFSFDAWVKDLETVVDTVNLDRFALLGISQGGAVAIAYTIRHPEKVSHLILYGAYAQGGMRRQFSDESEKHQALSTLVKLGWGTDNPAFRQVFSNLFMPEATPEQLNWLTELQQKTTSPENAVKFYDVFGNIDVADLLPKISVPTLVLHANEDARVPLDAGRQLAAAIPDARFVSLASKNHILIESEPAWQRFKQEVFGFLGTESTATKKETAPPKLGHVKLAVGKVISNYEILEKLGSGGMGVVYKARDQKLDRLVAMKFLPPSLSMDEGTKQRFVQEAKAASGLDHQNICTIYQIGETEDDQLFLVMPCYEGETLDLKITRGPLPIQDVLDYSAQIAEGLTQAHQAGIVHRDIKPANIMVTNHGQLKLLDFGLAKISDVNLTKTGATVGTTAYMSPEQVRGEKVDTRTDLWSLGVIFYEMVTGERPFKGEYEQAVFYSIMQEEPTALRTLRSEVTEDLVKIVDRLLQKDPSHRYQKAEELLADLN